MIKPLASELLKSCLIENHVPEGMLSKNTCNPESFEDETAVEITDLPGEFTTQCNVENITPADWQAFLQRVQDVFAENGSLKAVAEHGGRNYEYRLQQQQMAIAHIGIFHILVREGVFIANR